MSELLSKIHNNLKFDLDLLRAPNLSTAQKFSFLPRKYLAVLLNRREISYLGDPFYYDGRFAPVALQMYPKEIAKLDKILNLKNLKTVIDIRANIGQFAYTLKKFFPHVEIHSFEPNQEIFTTLKKNTQSLKINCHNKGIGKKEGTREFYFSPSGSGTGSFYEQNVHQFYVKPDIRKITVDIINLSKKNTKKLKLPQNIDLLKIDVEGAEAEVLAALSGIKPTYILLEVSRNRQGQTNLEDLKKIMKKTWKKEPTILWKHLPSPDAPSMDVILRLK